MREVFTNQDVTLVGYYKSILDEAGISSFIRNEYTANPEIAGAVFPALCVVDDVDYDKSIHILKSHRVDKPTPVNEWTCPSCLETNPSNFESCWKCNSSKPTVSKDVPASKPPTRTRDHSETGKNVYLLILICMFSVGIWCISMTWGDLMEAFYSSGWPTAPGEIVSSHVHRYYVGAGRRGNSSYLPEITYTYTVAGQNFTGTTVSPGRWWSYASANEVVERFPRNSTQAISYSSSDPARSILDPGLHPANFGHFMMGMIFCTLAIPFGFLWAGYGKNKSGSIKSFKKTSTSSVIISLVIAVAFLEFCILVWLSRS